MQNWYLFRFITSKIQYLRFLLYFVNIFQLRIAILQEFIEKKSITFVIRDRFWRYCDVNRGLKGSEID